MWCVVYEPLQLGSQPEAGVTAMARQTRTKQQIMSLLRRLGNENNEVDEAERLLPDPVDLDRDADLLRKLGLTVDSAVNELGGSPY